MTIEFQPQVTRVEVLDESGRVFSGRYGIPGVTLSIQDDGRTLKLFLNGIRE